MYNHFCYYVTFSNSLIVTKKVFLQFIQLLVTIFYARGYTYLEIPVKTGQIQKLLKPEFEI